jgi:UDP-glucuronate 4-epimerase
MTKILVTGSAGFIGFNFVSKLLLENGFEIYGIDNINDYYDVNLKYDRLNLHGIDKSFIDWKKIVFSSKFSNYKFVKADISDFEFIIDFMTSIKFDYVVNLAAQAGVRYSLINPRAYTKSNIDGFLSILEGACKSDVKHIVYASTSSVYGLNSMMPLNENHATEHPISLYAATKKSNEMMAHCYSHLYRLPSTGLRFFTVYGPWGRPDMALFLFADLILSGKPIKLFNYGNMIRDFTYVEDIVESIFRVMLKPAASNIEWNSNTPEISTSSAPYQIFNIGNSSPVRLTEYIEALEQCLGVTAEKIYDEIQPGDVPATHADTTKLEAYINFKPKTNILDGVNSFVNWYLTNYKKA